MSKAKDLHDQSLEELEAKLTETRSELFKLVNAVKHTKKLEQPHLIPKTKKEIAQLLTVIRQKQIAAQKS